MMASHKTLIVFASLAFLQSCSGFVGSMLPLSVNRICQKNVVQMSAVDRRGALKTGFSFAVATVLYAISLCWCFALNQMNFFYRLLDLVLSGPMMLLIGWKSRILLLAKLISTTPRPRRPVLRSQVLQQLLSL